MLFPNLERINLSEGENEYDNGTLESYTGIVLDPDKNQFKVITGKYEDKKDMYEKLFAQGYVLRKCFESKIWDWIEKNAPDDIIAYLMYSTAFSKWKGNNMLGKYYVKLLKDLPDITREGSKGNPGTKGKNSSREKRINKESVEENDIPLEEARTGTEESYIVRVLACDKDKKPIKAFQQTLRVDPLIFQNYIENNEIDANKVIQKDPETIKYINQIVNGEEGLINKKDVNGVYVAIFDENRENNLTDPSYFNDDTVRDLYSNSLKSGINEFDQDKSKNDRLHNVNQAIKELEKNENRTSEQNAQLDSLKQIRAKLSLDKTYWTEDQINLKKLVSLTNLKDPESLNKKLLNGEVNNIVGTLIDFEPDTKGLLKGYTNINDLKVARDNGEIKISDKEIDDIDNKLNLYSEVKNLRNDLQRIILNFNELNTNNPFNQITSNILKNEYNNRSYKELSNEEQDELKKKVKDKQKEYYEKLISGTNYKLTATKDGKFSLERDDNLNEILYDKLARSRSDSERETTNSPENAKAAAQDAEQLFKDRGNLEVNTRRPKLGTGNTEEVWDSQNARIRKNAANVGVPDAMKSKGKGFGVSINTGDNIPVDTLTPEQEKTKLQMFRNRLIAQSNDAIQSNNENIKSILDSILSSNGKTSKRNEALIRNAKNNIEKEEKKLNILQRDEYQNEDELRIALGLQPSEEYRYKNLSTKEAAVNDAIYNVNNPSPFDNTNNLRNIPGAIIPISGQFLSEDMTSDTLNVDIFDGHKMKENVRNALIKIGDAFKDKLDLPFEPVDMYLTGSMANYNYNDSSDIDVHLVYDYENAGINAEVLNKYVKSAKANFNAEHNIKIKNHTVEVGVENINDPLVSTGIYSLIQDNWIVEPTNKSTEYNGIDENDYKLVERLIKSVIFGKNIIELKKAIKLIHDMRKNSLSKSGEFGMGNLLYKALRSNGIIDELHKAYHELEDKEMSVNENKDIIND